MECYAKGYCKLHSTAKCNSNCDFKIVLDALYNLSNIPKRYRHDTPLRPEQIDLQAFKDLKEYKSICSGLSGVSCLYLLGILLRLYNASKTILKSQLLLHLAVLCNLQYPLA